MTPAPVRGAARLFWCTLVVLLAGRAGTPSAGAQGAGGWSFPEALEDRPGAAAPESPTLVADAAGNQHAAWVDYRAGAAAPGVFYARRRAGGAWSANEEAVAARLGVTRSDPQLALDAQGNVLLVWVEAAGPGDPDIFVASRAAAGSAWSAPRRVNDDTGHAAQGEPRVAGDLWGSVHVVWTDLRNGGPDIYHSRVLYGKAPGANVRVNTMQTGDQSEPALVVSAAGTLHAAWVDTRESRADIYASQIPHGGLAPEIAAGELAWWPDARLDYEPGALRNGSPTLAAGQGDIVRAVWTTGSNQLRAADLLPDSPYWQIDRLVYEAPAGAGVAAPAVAMDPVGATEVAWVQERDGTRTVWSGRLEELGLSAVTQVDADPLTVRGGGVALAMAGDSVAHAAWVGQTRFGDVHVYHGQRALPPPAYPEVTYEGWLVYATGRMSCPGDGLLIADCAGSTGPWIVASGVDPNFIGRWVRARGTLVEGTACPLMRASVVNLASPPCPRDSGTVTGVVRAGGQPVDGATVTVGDVRATTGPSGRFAAEVAGGAHDVLAAAPCSLAAALPAVGVQPGFTRALPDAELVRGDVQADCAVDLMDLVRVTLRYKEPPPYPACADLDGDGVVSIYDVGAVTGAYGLTCPTAWTPADVAAVTTGVVPDGSSTSGEWWGVAVVAEGTARVAAWEAAVAFDPALYAPRAGPFVAPAGARFLRNVALVDAGRLEVAAAAPAPGVLAYLPGARMEGVRLVSASLSDARGGRAAVPSPRLLPWARLFVPRATR